MGDKTAGENPEGFSGDGSMDGASPGAPAGVVQASPAGAEGGARYVCAECIAPGLVNLPPETLASVGPIVRRATGLIRYAGLTLEDEPTNAPLMERSCQRGVKAQGGSFECQGCPDPVGCIGRAAELESQAQPPGAARQVRDAHEEARQVRATVPTAGVPRPSPERDHLRPFQRAALDSIRAAGELAASVHVAVSAPSATMPPLHPMPPRADVKAATEASEGAGADATVASVGPAPSGASTAGHAEPFEPFPPFQNVRMWNGTAHVYGHVLAGGESGTVAVGWYSPLHVSGTYSPNQLELAPGGRRVLPFYDGPPADSEAACFDCAMRLPFPHLHLGRAPTDLGLICQGCESPGASGEPRWWVARTAIRALRSELEARLEASAARVAATPVQNGVPSGCPVPPLLAPRVGHESALLPPPLGGGPDVVIERLERIERKVDELLAAVAGRTAQ